MSLALYAANCEGLVQELVKSLDDADIAALRQDCAALGFEGMKRWSGNNLNLVEKYVRATPSQRKKKKEWRDPVLRGRLVLSSIQYISLARNFLEGIEEHMIWPGGSYRDMAAAAGKAFYSIFWKGVDAWPFPGENPFV
jgi:hypothetical protein